MIMPDTIFALANRGVLSLSGDDRLSFLQGLISNDIALCTPERPLFAALLTPQGKFLFDLFIVNQGNRFLVDAELARIDELLALLTKYKLRAKVAIENVSDSFGVWGALNGSIGLPDPRLAALGSRGIFVKSEAPIETNTSDAYDFHRLQLGVPDGSRDLIVGKSTLSEGNFDLLNGISWTKGCYVGQELTARMHHRGLVKKRLFPVKITGSTPAFGSLIHLNGKEIGEMRGSNGTFGLALLTIEVIKPILAQKQPINCENALLDPSQPDWLEI